MRVNARKPSRTVPRDAPKPTNASVAYRLRMANRALARGWEAALQRLQVEEAHYYYLRILFEEDGLTQADLGERLGIVAPAVTGVLDRMEAQGFVRRVADASDRRKRRVFLTTKGNALRKPLLELMQSRNAALLDGVSEADYAVFSRVLDAIVANAAVDDTARAGPRR